MYGKLLRYMQLISHAILGGSDIQEVLSLTVSANMLEACCTLRTFTVMDGKGF